MKLKLKKLSQKGFSHHFILPVIVMVVVVAIGIKLITGTHAANIPTANPGNTYAYWYFRGSNYKSLQWTVVPLVNPPASMGDKTTAQPAGALHYYAYQFAVMNATSKVGGGYAGFQTTGYFEGNDVGEAINFSIWGSVGGSTPNGLLNSDNSESGGYQIMLPYKWTLGDHYRFYLQAGPTAPNSRGHWWGLWVRDLTTQVATYVGEEQVPGTINGHPSTRLSGSTLAFGEDTHWWYALNGTDKYKCSDFPTSSMAVINVFANGDIKPYAVSPTTNSGQQNTGSNGYVTDNCTVKIYTNSKDFDVQENLGYWSPANTNELSKLAASSGSEALSAEDSPATTSSVGSNDSDTSYSNSNIVSSTTSGSATNTQLTPLPFSD